MSRLRIIVGVEHAADDMSQTLPSSNAAAEASRACQRCERKCRVLMFVWHCQVQNTHSVSLQGVMQHRQV
jgi:hypothetical protein